MPRLLARAAWLAPTLVERAPALRTGGDPRGAVRLAPFFAPPSRLGLFLRNLVMKLMALPYVTELAVGRSLRDAVELPDY